MKLDRSRSFGTVYGGSGHAYEQDGKFFDHEGELVATDESKAEDQPKKPGRPPKAKEDAPKEDDQLSAQLST